MTPSRILFAALVTVAAAACGSDGHDGGTGGPEAPTGLGAEPLGGGAHLTWTDNSDSETEFMVMRMEEGGDTAYVAISTLEFDSEQYHDAPLTSGSTYMYMVMAMNGMGEASSNEVTFAAP